MLSEPRGAMTAAIVLPGQARIWDARRAMRCSHGTHVGDVGAAHDSAAWEAGGGGWGREGAGEFRFPPALGLPWEGVSGCGGGWVGQEVRIAGNAHCSNSTWCTMLMTGMADDDASPHGHGPLPMHSPPQHKACFKAPCKTMRARCRPMAGPILPHLPLSALPCPAPTRTDLPPTWGRQRRGWGWSGR